MPPLSILLVLILVVLLYVGRKLEVIAHLIYDGNKELKDKLDGILVQTDYASTYLAKITEMMEKDRIEGNGNQI
jgi:hypothetical protein